MRANPPKGHGLDDIIRHQAQALSRASYWGDVEEDAFNRMEAARTKRTRDKWREVVTQAQARRLRAEDDFAKYEQEEVRLLARRERKRRPPPPPARPSKTYEYVLKVDYKADPRSGNSRGGRDCYFDIRLRKEDGSKATADELRLLTGYMKQGEVPRGWEMRAIYWGRGERETDETPPRGPGDESDFDNLSRMISQRLRPTEIGEEEVDD